MQDGSGEGEQEADKSATQTTTELGINGCNLYRWLNKYVELKKKSRKSKLKSW